MACQCTVAAIEAFCGGLNANGLDRTLNITCEEELLAIPAPATDTHKITSAITYRAAATGPPAVAAGKFYQWSFSKEDQTFTSDRDEATGLWKTEVKIFVPKLQDTTSYTLNGLTGDNLVAIVKDRNGKSRLVGALGNGANLKVKEQTNPKNGYEVVIMWESAYSPYFYESTITN